MSNLLPGGLSALQPRTRPRTLARVGTIQRPLSPCPLLPSAPGLTEQLLGSPFCSQLFCSVQRCLGYPRLKTWYLGLPLVHHPPSWDPWLPTARHLPEDKWKSCSSPSVSAHPEHQIAGRTWVFPHFLLFPTPTAPQYPTDRQQLWDSPHSSCLGPT